MYYLKYIQDNTGLNNNDRRRHKLEISNSVLNTSLILIDQIAFVCWIVKLFILTLNISSLNVHQWNFLLISLVQKLEYNLQLIILIFNFNCNCREAIFLAICASVMEIGDHWNFNKAYFFLLNPRDLTDHSCSDFESTETFLRQFKVKIIWADINLIDVIE